VEAVGCKGHPRKVNGSMKKVKTEYNIQVEKREGNKSLGRNIFRWEDNIRMDFKNRIRRC
jgi:hypothetical protein